MSIHIVSAPQLQQLLKAFNLILSTKSGFKFESLGVSLEALLLNRTLLPHSRKVFIYLLGQSSF